MKIGILTQPLHSNYGGVLQAFALQQVLKRLGHEVETLNRVYTRPPMRTYFFRFGSLLKTIYRRYIRGDKRYIVRSPFDINYDVRRHGNLKFPSKHIAKSPNLYSSHELAQYVKRKGFAALVVGSDQVWRKAYSPCISDYFGGFLDNESHLTRIAYAASFGSDEWEGNEIETSVCAQCAKKFRAISVRENSGVILSRAIFGVDAIHVLDPTMLLDKKDYEALVINHHTTPCQGDLNCYILDQNIAVNSMIRQCASSMGLQPFYTNETLSETNSYQPTVEEWIRGFMDAKFVITDSFHACVFSILFQKPFIVWGNNRRGMARFESLLSIFGLQDRMVTSLADFETRKAMLLEPMDYRHTMETLTKWRKKSMDFLISNLHK